MPDDDIKISVATSANTAGLDKAKEAVKKLTAEAERAPKSIDEAGAAVEKLGKKTGAVSYVLEKFRSRLESLALGTAFTAALAAAGALLAKVGKEVKEIIDLLTPAKLKVQETGAAVEDTTARLEAQAEVVERLAGAYEKASAAADRLRQQQDEIADAQLAADLAGVDALEASGAVKSPQARLVRASLRLGAAQAKRQREQKLIADQEGAIKAQQAVSGAQYDTAVAAQRTKEAKREELLSQASAVLGIPKEQLRDSRAFETEFNAAINRTFPTITGPGGTIDALPRTPDDLRREAEVRGLSPLLPLLLEHESEFRDRRLNRARDNLAGVNAIAAERLPELERQRQLSELRGITAERNAAADVFGAGDIPIPGGGRAAVSNAVGSYQQLLSLVNQLINVGESNAAQVASLRSRVSRLQQRLRNDPYTPQS